MEYAIIFGLSCSGIIILFTPLPETPAEVFRSIYYTLIAFILGMCGTFAIKNIAEGIVYLAFKLF